MKQFYLVGGAMGVGKTTACRVLQETLEQSVYLDGDWCWDARPFVVTAETKQMVLENIVFLLNNFLHVSAYQHIIFSWVMHQQEIIDELLSRVDTSICTTHVISLVCKPEILQKRLERDIDAGVRQADSLDRAAAYLPLYSHLHTRKIDVSALTPVQTAQAIVALCGQ